jgi:uncharacterized membrane protein|tara:strand:+ start:1641 stop:1886 length:246 start_codon:yes stop_codon:yes gene_type:complete
MNDLFKKVFGPLDVRFCDYFLILSIIGFVLLAILLVSSLVVGILQKKGIDFYMQVISIALGYALLYFQNRLLNSMCVSSLK